MKKRTILYSVVCWAFLFGACANRKDAPEMTMPEYEPLVIGKGRQALKDSLKQIEIHVDMPEVEAPYWRALRKHIMGFYMRNRYDFERFASDMDTGMPCVMRGGYDIHTQNDTSLSLSLHTEWAVPGTSTLLYHHQAVNWDLEDNRLRVNVAGTLFERDSTARIIEKLQEAVEPPCVLVPYQPLPSVTYSDEGVYFHQPDMEPAPGCDVRKVFLEWKRLR